MTTYTAPRTSLRSQFDSPISPAARGCVFTGTLEADVRSFDPASGWGIATFPSTGAEFLFHVTSEAKPVAVRDFQREHNVVRYDMDQTVEQREDGEWSIELEIGDKDDRRWKVPSVVLGL